MFVIIGKFGLLVTHQHIEALINPWALQDASLPGAGAGNLGLQCDGVVICELRGNKGFLKLSFELLAKLMSDLQLLGIVNAFTS